MRCWFLMRKQYGQEPHRRLPTASSRRLEVSCVALDRRASPSRSSMSCALGGIVRGAIDGQATNLSLNFAIDKFNAKFCHLTRSDP